MKDNSNDWSHSVVTCPVREMFKLYEVGYTTFADDMAAAYEASRKILLSRGALPEESLKSSRNNLIKVCVLDSNLFKAHEPFLSCVSSSSGFEFQSENEQYESDYSNTESEIEQHGYVNEFAIKMIKLMILLI